MRKSAPFWLCVLLSTACGGSEDDEKSTQAQDDTNESTLEIPDEVLDGLGDGHDIVGIDDAGICHDLTVVEGCSGQVFEGESVPVDLYLMFDQSGSMSTVVDDDTGTTRMDIVKAAVSAFLSDEESIGLGAGIGYFGHQPLGETSCSPTDYSDAAVEIGRLPAAEEALLASLDEREPTGETPTGAAIIGACSYVSQFRLENPGRTPAILLVTDGEPKAPLSEEFCSPTLGEAVEEAERCFEEEGIRVYVLGVGPSLSNLTLIAEAGGTEEAFLAHTDNADDVLSAFRAVRGAAQLPCEIEISRETEDSEEAPEVTVAYLDFGCSYVSVEQKESEDDCETGGFFLDDPDDPKTIHLCEPTCDDLKSTGRQLFYSLGCPLEVVR